MVEEGISTALIMEDDMDWDVRLKSQLQRIAAGTRSFQTSPDDGLPPASPYGDKWDLLWLGHCGEVFPETLPEYESLDATSPEFIALSTKYTMRNDPTVPHPSHTAGFQNFTASPYTRWVHISGGPICSFAYALSLQGARKVMYDLSVDHLTGPFDNALSGLCRWGRQETQLGMRFVFVEAMLKPGPRARPHGLRVSLHRQRIRLTSWTGVSRSPPRSSCITGRRASFTATLTSRPWETAGPARCERSG